MWGLLLVIFGSEQHVQRSKSIKNSRKNRNLRAEIFKFTAFLLQIEGRLTFEWNIHENRTGRWRWRFQPHSFKIDETGLHYEILRK